MDKIICNPGRESWDRYVLANPRTTPYHLYDWQEVIGRTYGHRPYYLALLTSQKEICGILPLIHIAPPLEAGRLISLPFFDSAGLAADDRRTEEKLLQEAFRLAEKLGADHLELRQDTPPLLTQKVFQKIAPPKILHHAHNFKIGLRRKLPTNPDELWHAFPAKLRNQIRKPLKLDCKATTGGPELLTEFYQILATNMRDLGSPVHARQWFTETLNQFAERIRIVVVHRQEKALAAALLIEFRDSLHNPWASSLRAFRPLGPNMLLYWEMLALGCRKGIRFFDFGRSSPQASTCRFKLQWGAQIRPLTWHLFSPRTIPWSPHNENLSYTFWRNLDLKVAERLGPPLRGWISL